MQRWDDVPEEHRRVPNRLMEVYAGFSEHTDRQYGKVLDEIERLGQLDNTLIFYINSDNGASAEGMFGTISEILAKTACGSTSISRSRCSTCAYGGIDALGTPIVDRSITLAGPTRELHPSSRQSWLPLTSAAPEHRWSSHGPRVKHDRSPGRSSIM